MKNNKLKVRSISNDNALPDNADDIFSLIAKQDDKEVARLLHYFPDIVNEVEPETNLTPLYFAIYKRSAALVRLLLKHCKNMLKGEEYFKLYPFVIRNVENEKVCAEILTEIKQAPLSFFYDVNELVPLLEVVSEAIVNERRELLKVLMRREVAINAHWLDTTTNKPLLELVLNHVPSMLPFFIENGADINVVNANQQTFLHRVALGELNEHLLPTLMHYQIKPYTAVTIGNMRGVLAFQIAFARGKLALARTMIDYYCKSSWYGKDKELGKLEDAHFISQLQEQLAGVKLVATPEEATNVYIEPLHLCIVEMVQNKDFTNVEKLADFLPASTIEVLRRHQAHLPLLMEKIIASTERVEDQKVKKFVAKTLSLSEYDKELQSIHSALIRIDKLTGGRLMQKAFIGGAAEQPMQNMRKFGHPVFSTQSLNPKQKVEKVKYHDSRERANCSPS